MKQHGPGDYLMILSYAVLIVNFVFTYRIVQTPGVFVHQWNVHLGDFIIFLRDVFITTQLYIGSILLIKVAILLEWVRIFSPTGHRRFVYWASHIMIWANVIFYVSIFVAINAACTPYALNWNVLLSGSCARVNTHYTNLATSIFNLISDIMILLIPQRSIWNLRLTFKKKLGVSVVFAIGALACISALIRLVETVRHALSDDFVYTFAGIMMCCAAELTCGFLVLSIPNFPKAFSAINFTKIFSKLSYNSSSGKTASPSQSGEASSWPQSSGVYKNLQAGSAEVFQGRATDHHSLAMAELHTKSSLDYSKYSHIGNAQQNMHHPNQSVEMETFDPHATKSDFIRQGQWDDNRQ